MAVAFFANICGGIGVALNSTSCIALLTTHYSKNRETMVAYAVGTDALARIIAPLFGSGLYALGGYLVPFYASSLINLFFYVLLIAPVMICINFKEKEIEKIEKRTKETGKIKYFDLFSVKRFTFGFLGNFLQIFTYYFIMTNLSFRLIELQVKPEFYPLFWSISAVGMLVNGPLV